jgi:hypothetical protein
MTRIATVFASLLSMFLTVAADANAIRTVAFTGQHAPGTPADVNFHTFNFAPVINDSGQTAFWAVLNSADTDGYLKTGIWPEGNGILVPVALRGSPPPGSSSESRFYEFDVYSFTLNDAGKAAFVATYYNGANFNDRRVGLWSEGFGTLAPVARSVDIAPGSPGLYFSSLYPPMLNNAGQTAFGAFA